MEHYNGHSKDIPCRASNQTCESTNTRVAEAFSDWLRNFRIVFRSKKILFILDEAILKVAPADAPIEDHVVYSQYKDAEKMAIYLMLGLLRKQVNFIELIIYKQLSSVTFFL